MVWYGVVWCGVVWCGMVWCGMVWCGMVWCGVVGWGVVWDEIMPLISGDSPQPAQRGRAPQAIRRAEVVVVCHHGLGHSHLGLGLGLGLGRGGRRVSPWFGPFSPTRHCPRHGPWIGEPPGPDGRGWFEYDSFRIIVGC